MVILKFNFPAKRYHATPWDAHVNEGRVEWPPSPWRLLRSLLAVGYTKLGWQAEPDAAALAVIDKLAECDPAYSLPAATEAHTRHYMPTRGNPSKVFDGFLRFESSDSDLLVQYEVDLLASEMQELEQMVAGLTYLGRAESWVEASVLTEHEALAAVQQRQWCRADEQSHGPPPGRPVRLMAAVPEQEFSECRTKNVGELFAAIELAEQKKQALKGKLPNAATIKRLHAKAEQSFPADRLKALQADTADWQSQGWPQPPGSRWVNYSVPNELLQSRPLMPVPRHTASATVEAVLLAIDGDGKQGTVRPQMRRTLPLMELLHQTAVFKATEKLGLGNVQQLTGKNDHGQPLQGHRHTHWLPLSLFGNNTDSHGTKTIDHVLVYAPDGLPPEAVAALSAIRWAYSKRIQRLSVNLAALGLRSDLLREIARSPQLNRDAVSIMERGTVWESVTPLVLRKYLHKRGKKTIEGQLREELRERNFDDPVSIRVWSSEEMVARKLKGFVVQRGQGKRQPPVAASWAATIRFARNQSGPLALGYASHFGLGVFRCRPSDSDRSSNRAG